MRIATLILVIVFAATAAFAQTEEPKTPPEIETLQNVVMDAMHGPVESGDAEGTAESYPALKEANAAVQGMKLPEAYADVAAEFDKARAHMNDAVVAFFGAVEKSDSVAILATMLKVHESMSQVEAALSGMCYELVALHDVIAPIQHRALPDENWAAIKAALPDLKAHIDALGRAELPAKHAAVKVDLDRQVAHLHAAWAELKSACETDEPKAIATAFGKIHDHFHSCIELFP
jgi:hypothetical protein